MGDPKSWRTAHPDTPEQGAIDPSDCMVLVAVERGESSDITYYDFDGDRIGEARGPREWSIAQPKRWGWLVVSPFMDVYLTGILVVGGPITAGVLPYRLIFDGVEEVELAKDRSHGPVTGLIERPPDAFALLVLAHGAGADMRHRFMAAIADELAALGVATLRFNFPYTEARRRAPDPQPVLEAYARSACAEARALAPDLPLFAGGKSMGGRMTSNACAKEPLAGVRGLVFLGFPLHPPKKPSRARAEHLARVTLPMLFLQGTRDDLADLALIREVTRELGPRAAPVEYELANHSFEVPKKSGRTNAEVLQSLAREIAAFTRRS